MQVGETKTFNYTGAVQSIALMPGQYKLECWGAGGGNDSQRGGYGGYSYGHIDINQQQTLYICVGGAGASAASGRGGGYNGGGNAGGSGSSGAGGGATHIALTNRGILSNYNSYRSEIILVAGAGGGGGNSGSNTIGGNGGGLSGQRAGASGVATQTSGNAFGQGGHRYGDGGGGGGGWYGGYAAAGDNGGGGGSSYYNTSKLYDYGTTSGVVPNTQHGHVVVTCILLFTGDSKVNFLLQNLNQTDYFTTESLDYSVLTSDDISNIPYKKYDGFTLDNSLQQIYYDNVLQKLIINCYYTRNIYTLTLNDGTSQKYSYLYEEQGDIHYNRYPVNYLRKFKDWISDVPVNIDLPYLKDTTFIMPASDLTISAEFADQDRVNTNIYKNIFDSFLFDLYNFQTILNGPYKQETTIFQYNHGFQIYDLLKLNQSGLYEKGIATESKYDVIGMVTKILNDHEFVLTTYGPIETNINFSSDSGILYLSDTQEGKFCTYEELTTNFYTPIGFYTGNTVTLNILDSSVGDVLKKYCDTVYEHEQDLPHITETEKQDIIQEVFNNA